METSYNADSGIRDGIHLAYRNVRCDIQPEHRTSNFLSFTWGRLGKPSRWKTRGRRSEFQPYATVPGLLFRRYDTWLFHMYRNIYMVLVSISTLAGHHVREIKG